MLKSTDIDNRIVSWIGGDSQGKSLQIEDWIANLTFWLIFLFAIVALILQKLELDGVSGPLASLLGKVTSFLPSSHCCCNFDWGGLVTSHVGQTRRYPSVGYDGVG